MNNNEAYSTTVHRRSHNIDNRSAKILYATIKGPEDIQMLHTNKYKATNRSPLCPLLTKQQRQNKRERQIAGGSGGRGI